MSIYPIAAAHTAGTTSSGTSSGSSSATDYNAIYMQLLATELQSQDPTQPQDPTTMVTQMVQINQLSDVAGIYSLLQNQSSASGSEHAAAVHATSQVGGN